ncbi:MAG: hypothetical protein R3D55_24450 [Chloroflexota bacterium]
MAPVGWLAATVIRPLCASTTILQKPDPTQLAPGSIVLGQPLHTG